MHLLSNDPWWFAPFAGLPSALWIDPLTGASGSGEGVQVAVLLGYRSGATAEGLLSSPAPGVVRLTVGQPDLVLDGQPAVIRVEQRAGAVSFEADGVRGSLGTGGLVTESLPRPGAVTLAVADKRALPIADSAAVTGRLMHHDAAVGWAESVALEPGAAVYGSGESFSALDLRGRRRTLRNVETHTAAGRDLAYLNVPLLWSTAGWAVLVNTGGMVGADIGASQQETLSLAVAGPSLDLLAFAGTPAEILARYWQLTGTPGSVPDWAFGVWMSRATYVSEAEVHQVLDDLAAADATPDVVHVDAWLAGNVFRTFTCEWRADRERFPAGWTERLRERGVRSSVWLNPFLLAGSEAGQQARRDGLLLCWPDGSPACTDDRHDRWIIDFTNPAAVRWWHDRVADLLATEGPDALKLDFAEEIPENAVCHDGRTGAQVRNAYARMYQQATAEALRAARAGAEVPLFCRSGTHGAQRNPAHWVGDSPATWDGLTAALYAVQSMAMSGFGIVTHDSGGFVSPGTGEIPTRRLDGQDVDFTAEVDPELYVRWVQWGAVSPFMRLHGLGLREPTAYPEPHRSAAVAAFGLRRRLAPYLAAAYREGLAQGLPLLRPMALQRPADRSARDADLQYFLGPDVLVAPVLQPGGQCEFLLPPGRWENLFDRTPVQGGGWRREVFPLSSFPAFRRTG